MTTIRMVVCFLEKVDTDSLIYGSMVCQLWSPGRVTDLGGFQPPEGYGFMKSRGELLKS